MVMLDLRDAAIPGRVCHDEDELSPGVQLDWHQSIILCLEVLDALQLGGASEASLMVWTVYKYSRPEHQIRTAQHTAVSSRYQGKLRKDLGMAGDALWVHDVLQRSCAPYFQPWYMHSNISTQPLPSATGAALCRHTCRGATK